MKITDNVLYIGVNDNKTDLFESQYRLTNGVTYNSYLILDERIAVLDTVDRGFGSQWIDSLKLSLAGRTPDYLIVHHMEPDHSANIALFTEEFPTATVVSSAKAFTMMKSFFGTDYEDRRLVVGEGDRLSLGRHTLKFITAPMVHWPEVIMSFEEETGILFSADAFGRFGVLPMAEGEDWAEEARRYYIGIVGKYGPQVQAVLKKAAALSPKIICPLHGPVLRGDLGYYLGLYDTWSSYRPERRAVTIAYASVYGNTMRAAEELRRLLEARGLTAELYDLCRCDVYAAVASAFRNSDLVLAASTYNGDAFPPMRDFLHRLNERGFRARRVALIENGSWAPMAAKVMVGLLEGAKDIRFAEKRVRINSAPNEETTVELAALADELAKD